MKSKKLKKLIAMTIIATTVAANMPLGINSNVAFAIDVTYTDVNAAAADGFGVQLINNDTEYQITGFDKSKIGAIKIPSQIDSKSVTSIGYEAFAGCSKLTSINIPSGVTSIGLQAFFSCSKLISINIPSSVTSIGDGAFYGCMVLTSIYIPSGVTSISYGAFYGCSGLTSIYIPSGVTSIGEGAFDMCSGLTSISIPSSVTNIYKYAFDNINNEAIFYLPNNAVKNLLEQKGYPKSGTNQKVVKSAFQLTYDGNSSVGGSVPTDLTDYTSGQTVTVADNTGKLVKSGYTFDGWNTQTDGLGSSYAVGDTLNIKENTTLYAKWKVAIAAVTPTATAIKIKGTTKVGNNLSAEFVDANGNSVTTSAAVTYEWYRSSDNSETGDLVGNDATYQLTSSDAGKYINLVVLFDDKIFKFSTSKIANKASSSTSSSSSSNSSSSSSNTEQINVAVTDGSSNNSVSQTVMERTTASDGTKKDTINYTVSKAEQTVEALKKEGKDVARIVVPDTKDEVSEDKVNISAATISVLSKGNVKLEIDTENARISLSKESLQDLSQNGAVQGNGDLYFRLVPVKDEKKQQEIETIANQEQVVRQASGNSIVEVLGRPMQIETNMINKSVDIILPLKGVILPNDSAQREAFLKDLGIFIEHSDGEKVLARGEIVEYAPGVLGLKFTVNKFSTFSIVKLNQKITGVGSWQNTAEGWKYIKDGNLATGWNLINGYWYLMDSTGVMETGWRETKGTWYLLNNDGAMETGWQQTNGHWYLLNTDGGMMMGWQKVNTQWYYLYEDGSMASDTTINGYGLDSNGAWVK